jgi:hypothetical protein
MLYLVGKTQFALHGVRRTRAGFSEDHTWIASYRVSALLTRRSG